MIRCAFCQDAADSPSLAADDGWLSSYWDDATDREIDAPVCPSCCHSRLIVCEPHGDFMLPAEPAEPQPDAVIEGGH